MANVIEISDFNLFFEAMKSAAKIVDAAKLLFSPNGLEIYGARDVAARCELTTNAVSSKDTFDFCIDNINMLNKVLATAKEIHSDDFSALEIKYNRPNLMFKSKKFKMKYSTCNESTITKWVSKKIETKMQTLFEFKTTSDLIKRMNGHAFLFDDSKSINVYLETDDTMEANTVFATLGNKNVDIGKEITLKLGLVTLGAMPPDKRLIVDLERMNLFNCIQSDDIKIGYMDKGCLLSQTHVQGKNGTYFNVNVYSTLLKG